MFSINTLHQKLNDDEYSTSNGMFYVVNLNVQSKLLKGILCYKSCKKVPDIEELFIHEILKHLLKVIVKL